MPLLVKCHVCNNRKTRTMCRDCGQYVCEDCRNVFGVCPECVELDNNYQDMRTEDYRHSIDGDIGGEA
jgi:hypothetical protein